MKNNDPLRMIRLNHVPAVVETITGERPNIATVYRWHLNGLKGVKLKTAFAGGVRRTTEAWVREFFAAVTAAANGETRHATPDQSRSKRIADAERDLATAEF